MIAFLSTAYNSSIMEQKLKLKSIESQPILACFYISMVILINATDSLLKTMLCCAYALSSTTEAFNEECAKLCTIFSRLDYPWSLIDSVIISNFDAKKPTVSTAERNADKSNIVIINLHVQ